MSEASKHFSLDMTVAEAMTKHPRAAEVFAAFHLGGCSHCGISQIETIEQVCQAYGVDGDVLIQVLDELMEKDPPQEAEARAAE